MKIIDAVEAGEVDVAIVWGPLAGYFAKKAKVPLDIVPVARGLSDYSIHVRHLARRQERK